jgi:hypothetical protein
MPISIPAAAAPNPRCQSIRSPRNPVTIGASSALIWMLM